MLGAVEFAYAQIQPAIDLIIDFAEDCAKEPFDFQAPDYSDLYAAVAKAGEKAMRAAYAIADKMDRQNRQMITRRKKGRRQIWNAEGVD